MVGRKPGETERGIESIDLEARCNVFIIFYFSMIPRCSNLVVLNFQGPGCCLVP